MSSPDPREPGEAGSTPTDDPRPSPAARLRTALARTRGAVGLTVRRRDSLAVVLGVALAYLGVYLWAVGDLAAGLGGLGVVVAADPLAALVRSTGPFSFGAVALVRLGPVSYLASLNTLLGLGLGVLVGLNLGLTYLTRRQPAACGLSEASTSGAGAGVLAGILALLSGSACCGPVVLIALGVQVSVVLLTAFQVLLPVAVLLLLVSLVAVGRRVRPAAHGG